MRASLVEDDAVLEVDDSVPSAYAALAAAVIAVDDGIVCGAPRVAAECDAELVEDDIVTPATPKGVVVSVPLVLEWH